MDNSGYSKKMISIVIPCFNESGNIPMLYSELSSILTPFSHEYIFVDDGSSDETLKTIKLLAKDDSQVKYLSFSRNFGQQSALLAGMRYATGDAVITMDADLQHPATLIPLLIKKWNEGFEVVNTMRLDTDNGIGFFKRLSSKAFYRLMNYVTDLGMSDGCADFRLLDGKIVEIIRQSKESDIFIRGLIKWYGFKQAEITYHAERRQSGETKYTLKRMVLFSLNGLTAFSIRPLRLSIVLSALLSILCSMEIIYALYTLLVKGTAVSGWTSIVILISIIGAMTLLMLGIIGEYVGRTFMQGKGRPAYIVSETNLAAS